MGLTIAKLIDALVEKYGPHGRATEEVERLQSELTIRLEETANPDEKKQLSADIEYIIGYLETPACTLADLIGKRARARQ